MSLCTMFPFFRMNYLLQHVIILSKKTWLKTSCIYSLIVCVEQECGPASSETLIDYNQEIFCLQSSYNLTKKGCFQVHVVVGIIHFFMGCWTQVSLPQRPLQHGRLLHQTLSAKKEIQSTNKMQVTIFSSLTMEVTPLPLCYVLQVRRKLLKPIKQKDYRKCEYQEV